jgi:hypothetical protein
VLRAAQPHGQPACSAAGPRATASPQRGLAACWVIHAGCAPAARGPLGFGLLALRRRYAGRTPHCTRTIPGVCGLPVPHGA